MRKLGSTCSGLLIAVAVLLVSCGPKMTVTEETRSDDDTSQTQAPEFDPLNLPGDMEIVPEEYPREGDIVGRDALVVVDQPVSDSTSLIVVDVPDAIDSVNSQAYRVQLFVSKFYGEAKGARTVAEEIFDRPVFLDYEVPYYKVRVGNFDERDAAERYRQRVRSSGYENAWVVMVNVDVRSASPLYDPNLFEQLPDSLQQPLNDNAGEAIPETNE